MSDPCPPTWNERRLDDSSGNLNLESCAPFEFKIAVSPYIVFNKLWYCVLH